MARLLVVATPIGNLNDLTPRMREALACADLIAAEDTRVTMKLLNRMELKKPLISCHRHNEDARAPQLIERMLAEDLTVALTCDAGTPAISDPGHALVRAAWESGIPVTPICGPSAVTTALSAAGFDAREFAFYGFLPREKKGAFRKTRRRARHGRAGGGVLRISPSRGGAGGGHRRALAGMSAGGMRRSFQEIRVAAARRAGRGARAAARQPQCRKGRILSGGRPLPPAAPQAPEPVSGSAVAAMAERLYAGDTLKEAAAAAKELGFSRNEVYRATLFLRPLEGE